MSLVLALALALALGAEEPRLPACAERIPSEATACDAAIAGEKDGRIVARLLVARAYRRNEVGEYDAALRDLDAAVAADPAYATGWHERSYTHSELRDFVRAVADSDEDVKLRPNDPNAYRERAFARHGLGDLKGAWEDRAKVVALEPQSPGARAARGKAALWLGRFDEARADTEAALALAEKAGSAKDAAEARAQLETIKLWTTRSGAASPEAACRAAAKRGHFDEKGLIGDCTAAYLAAKSPRAKAELLTFRAFAQIVVANDPGAAIPDEAMAVALDPDHPEWHANLGGSYVRVRHSWAGRRELDVAIRLKDGWMARAERAVARYNLRDFEGSFEDAKKSFEERPNEVALTVLGDLAHDRHDEKSAKLYWMGAWHLGDRDDGLRERLKALGVADPDQEPGN
ncbi:MAG: hypothetical protein JO013_12590 [Alphaproteobacteria bacterium]|nr:hypothetical protein [Alphaproteobacteria bacterium]